MVALAVAAAINAESPNYDENMAVSDVVFINLDQDYEHEFLTMVSRVNDSQRFIHDIAIAEKFDNLESFKHVMFSADINDVPLESFISTSSVNTHNKMSNLFVSPKLKIESTYELLEVGSFNVNDRELKQTYTIENLQNINATVDLRLMYEIDSDYILWRGEKYYLNESLLRFNTMDSSDSEFINGNEINTFSDYSIIFGNSYYYFGDVLETNHTVSAISINGENYLVLELFFEIEGSGTYVVDPIIGWSDHLIKLVTGNGMSVFATDIDGDGDTDVVSALGAGGNKVEWYENTGGESPDWNSYVVNDTAVNEPVSVYAIDINGDSNVDVLSASVQDDKIAWYENDGNLPPNWTGHVINSSADGAKSVFAIDLDLDGDIDVLSASYNDDKIAWYENDGALIPGWTAHVVNSSADGAFSVFSIDLDRDGDMDVLSASELDSKIAWYENDGGSLPAWTGHNISSSASGARSVFAIDIDGDGDVDVLSASVFDDRIAWYENDGGSPPFWTAHSINTSADGAQSVHAKDIDHDGDIDVVSASNNDDKIAWYENNGSSPVGWTGHVITVSGQGPQSVFAIDINNDIAIDVVSGQFNSRVKWYESNLTPLEIVNITPVQVVEGADLVLGKTGLVRVEIRNNALGAISTNVSVTLEGNQLATFDDVRNKNISASSSEDFDFRFIPTQTGVQNFTVEVREG